MKTRIFPLALALALCLGLLPTAALAAGETQIDLGNGLTAKLSEPILGTREITGAIEDETGALTSPTVTAYVVSETTEFEFVGRYDSPRGSDCLAWVEDWSSWGYNGPLYIDDKELYEGTENGAEEYARRRFTHFSPGMYATVTFPEDWKGWGSEFSYRTTQTYFVVEKSAGKPEPAPTTAPGFVTKNGLNILFTQGKRNDAGLSHRLEFTNTTDKPIQGSYALLTYHSPTQAQFFFFDLDIAPGQTVTMERNSMFYRLSQAKMLWIAFDSPQEKEAFIEDAPIQGTAALEKGYYSVDFTEGPAFLRDAFGIQ